MDLIIMIKSGTHIPGMFFSTSLYLLALNLISFGQRVISKQREPTELVAI